MPVPCCVDKSRGCPVRAAPLSLVMASFLKGVMNLSRTSGGTLCSLLSCSQAAHTFCLCSTYLNRDTGKSKNEKRQTLCKRQCQTLAPVCCGWYCPLWMFWVRYIYFWNCCVVCVCSHVSMCEYMHACA